MLFSTQKSNQIEFLSFLWVRGHNSSLKTKKPSAKYNKSCEYFVCEHKFLLFSYPVLGNIKKNVDIDLLHSKKCKKAMQIALSGPNFC